MNTTERTNRSDTLEKFRRKSISEINTKTCFTGARKQLNCLNHYKELTHICSDLECLYKPLFCSECMNIEQVHISEHKQRILTVGQFIKLLEENPEYRGLRKMNWILEDLKEVDYPSWLNEKEKEFITSIEKEQEVLLENITKMLDQKVKDITNKLRFLILKQIENYHLFTKSIQKTSRELFENQMANCERLVNSSTKIKTTSELERVIKDAKNEILKLRTDDSTTHNYYKLVDIAENIEFYFRNGIEMYFQNGNQRMRIDDSGNSISEILKQRIEPIVTGFLEKIHFLTNSENKLGSGSSPTKRVTHSKGMNYNVSPSRIGKYIEELPHEVKLDNYFRLNINMKYLHYFEDQSYKLHLIDLERLHYVESVKDKAPEIFRTVDLDIDFKIPQGHASIITPNGQLFLIGGDGSNRTYEYDYYHKTLVKRRDMKTHRWGHGVCYINDFIYAIGGRSQECERYSVKRDQWESIAKMAGIVTCPTVCVVKNAYIYRFGGLSSNTIERYNIEQNEWKLVDVKNLYMGPMRIELFNQTEVVQINEEHVILFGGRGCYEATIFQIPHKKAGEKEYVIHKETIDMPGEILFFGAKNMIAFENCIYTVTSNGKRLVRYSEKRKLEFLA